jgi:hypothetical protein
MPGHVAPAEKIVLAVNVSNSLQILSTARSYAAESRGRSDKAAMLCLAAGGASAAFIFSGRSRRFPK